MPRPTCTACHSVDKKLIGPSFEDNAAKYEAEATAADRLAASIKNGSKGKWRAMAMPANVWVSDDDAHTVVAWILAQ